MTGNDNQRVKKSVATRSAAKSAPANAQKSVDEVCSVRIELRYTHPLIWREVEVPTSITLEVLHDVVQTAIVWSNCLCGSLLSAAEAMGCRWMMIGTSRQSPRRASFVCATC